MRIFISFFIRQCMYSRVHVCITCMNVYRHKTTLIRQQCLTNLTKHVLALTICSSTDVFTFGLCGVVVRRLKRIGADTHPLAHDPVFGNGHWVHMHGGYLLAAVVTCYTYKHVKSMSVVFIRIKQPWIMPSFTSSGFCIYLSIWHRFSRHSFWWSGGFSYTCTCCCWSNVFVESVCCSDDRCQYLLRHIISPFGQMWSVQQPSCGTGSTHISGNGIHMTSSQSVTGPGCEVRLRSI